ncbi:MAG: class I SAM-dependent RNA methyltransferase [Kiloniellales bacterium]
MRRKARPGGGRQVEVVIEAIGGRGDGVARLDPGFGPDLEQRPVFVPMTVPGDRVLLRLVGERAGGYRGEIVELLDPGPGRVEPPCPHYGPCGGCTLQHWQDERYAAWKGELLRQALARQGLGEAAIRPLLRVPPGGRRRASLAAEADAGGRLRLGFHGRASHQLVDIESCLLLTPGLVALLAPLRAALGALLGPRGRAQAVLTESEGGIDLLIAGIGAPELAAREALAAFAAEADLARLSWSALGVEPEPIVQRRTPVLHFGGVPVVPPPGGFIQPTAAGEAALVAAVLGYLGDGLGTGRGGTVADLYAGCGTFSFPLIAAGAARVHAVEGEGAALSALDAAARRAGLAGRLSAEQRDLERRPLRAAELARFDAVVFAPPRAGAKAQAAELAAASVGRVVAVSCNPNSFARDARTLVDGGFTLVEATPLDQFPWSGHLELVALFRR